MSRKKANGGEGNEKSVGRGDARRGRNEKGVGRAELAQRRERRGWMWMALGMFTLEVVMIVGVYAMGDGELRVNYTISKYVGLESWSAILFAVCNVVMLWYMWKYVQEAAVEYGRWWLGLMIMVMVCFLGLSLCPLGLFDGESGQQGVVSILHQVFARGMFGVMAVAAVVMGLNRRREKWFFRLCLGYVAYAVLCIVTSMTTQVFWDLSLILETAYIYGFYALLLV